MGICCAKHSSLVQPLVPAEYLPSVEEVPTVSRPNSSLSQRSVKTAWSISGNIIDGKYQNVEKFGLCEVSIDDVTGQPVIVISRCRFPSRRSYNEKNILGYLKHTLDKYVESDYTVIYCHYNSVDDNRPSFSWFKEAYNELDRKYKKNLKCLYIVHPTSTIRIVMNLFKPFISVKFGRKLRYVNFLHEIGSKISWQKLPIASDVLQHDEELIEKYGRNISRSKTENELVSPQQNPTQQFGVSLETLRRRSPERKIPQVMQETITYLSEHGLLAEGLFRKSPSAIDLEKLEAQYNHAENVVFDDPHLAASTLKSFLRKLPEPLLTFTFYQHAIDMTVADKSEINKMTISNLAVVFGPSLLWPQDQIASLTAVHSINNLVASLLEHYNLLFQDREATLKPGQTGP